MTQRLAKRLEGVSESATLRLNARAQEMKKQGRDVINLTTGEPDFAVPAPVAEAVIEAVRAGKSKYTPAAGIPELRQAIAARQNADHPARLARGLAAWTGSDVVVTNGAKQAIFNALLALCDPGDAVLVPAPYWLSYPDMVRLAGGIPSIVKAGIEQGFKLTPAQLAHWLDTVQGTPRALLFNSPSNPTGAVYSRDEIRALGEVLLAHPRARDLWVISDEIYDRVVTGEVPFASFLEMVPGWSHQTVTVNGLSKSSALTGWRVGWTIAPKVMTDALVTIQGQSTSGISSLSQYAAMKALTLNEREFDAWRAAYRRRRDAALEILAKPGKLELFRPPGAFYLFVGVGRVLEGRSGMRFCEELLEQTGVAVVPGEPFGEPDFVRLTFAIDDEALLEACRRIAAFVSR